MVKEGHFFQAIKIGAGENGRSGPLRYHVSRGDVNIGFDLFGSDVESSVGLLDDVGAFFVGPEIPGKSFKGAVVGGVCRESWHCLFTLKLIFD